MSVTEILFWQQRNWVAKYRMTLIILSWLLKSVRLNIRQTAEFLKIEKLKKNYYIFQTKFFCEKILWVEQLSKLKRNKNYNN